MDGANVIRQLQSIALLGKFFLQGAAYQRYRNIQVADLEFGGIESRITIFGAEMPSERHVDIFSANLGYKLAAGDVAIKINFVVLDLRLAFANGRVRRRWHGSGQARSGLSRWRGTHRGRRRRNVCWK